jgi:hypothetical protein
MPHSIVNYEETKGDSAREVGDRISLSLPGFRRFLWFRYVIKESMILSMMAHRLFDRYPHNVL